jgi:RNA polymerase sigma-70 factor (ECF subfamily)
MLFKPKSLLLNTVFLELAATIIHSDLVDRCKQGDALGFKALYHQYSKAMYNTALRIVNNTAEAEDVLQEAFMDAFRHIRDFENRSSFGAWLKQIVVNKSVTHLRRKKQDWIDIESAALPEIKEEELTDEAEIQFQVNQVLKGIQQLPNGYRTVLSLYLLEGYDHEEISEILGISHSTVRTQYIRAKERLLGILKHTTS